MANDQGLLGNPAQKLTELLLGPAERYEILISFSGHPGEKVTLRNSEPTLIGPGMSVLPLFGTIPQNTFSKMPYLFCFSLLQSKLAWTINLCSSMSKQKEQTLPTWAI